MVDRLRADEDTGPYAFASEYAVGADPCVRPIPPCIFKIIPI